MTLFESVFAGNDAVYGLTEGAINQAIEKYGADKAVSFPDTAYSLPCYYAVTGTKVGTLAELKDALAVVKTLMTREKRTNDVFMSGVATALCAEFIEVLKYIDGAVPYEAPCYGHLADAVIRELGVPLVTGDIPRDERLITIEDNAELRIRGIDNLVRLEAKMANMEGAVSVTIRDLIKSALRMRPDRIIVGEVRGGEAMDMLQALNTGHEGSLSTAHANSARDMLSRLETMVLMGVDLPLEAIRRQIASGVDILVHLGRMRDKSRKLLELTEVCGFENGEIRIRPLYQWQEGKGLVKTASLLHVEKLERAGIEL